MAVRFAHWERDRPPSGPASISDEGSARELSASQTLEGSHALAEGPFCSLGLQWFESLKTGNASHRIGGRIASLEECVAEAARVLAASKQTLVFGLDQATLAGQRAALRVAEKLRGILDTPLSVLHGPGGWALHQVGEATCTLGELNNRADRLVLWGARPEITHPRFLERFFSPDLKGLACRIIRETDPEETLGFVGKAAHIPLQPSQRIYALETLNALAQGAVLDEARVREACGQDLSVWVDLLNFLAAGKYSAIVLDSHDLPAAHRRLEQQAAYALVRKLQDRTRCVAIELGAPGNLAGATQLLTWSTGFPYAIDFSSGAPSYAVARRDAEALLSDPSSDTVLLAATNLYGLPSHALNRLASKTVIAVGAWQSLPFTPVVHVETAPLAWYETGTVFRMDGLSLPVKQLVPSSLPNLDHVLQRLEKLLPCRLD